MCTDYYRINRFPVEPKALAKLNLCAEHAAIVAARAPCMKTETVVVPVGTTGAKERAERACERPKGHDGPHFHNLVPRQFAPPE